MIKSVLILGGAGYLGEVIAEKFLTDGDIKVTIGDIKPSAHTSIDFINLDILTLSSLEIIKEHDIIINCLGQITSPINTCFRINSEGISNLVSIVNKFNKKIYHISTVAVYGTCEKAEENSSVNPESNYATCKAYSEFVINTNLTSEKYCILRMTNLYGGNQQKGLFAYLKKSFCTDKNLFFNNNGSLTRYFIHVEDCAYAVAQAIKKNLTGIYNVGTYEKFSIIEIIKFIEEQTGTKFITKFNQAQPLENIELLVLNKFTEATSFSNKRKLTEYIMGEFHL